MSGKMTPKWPACPGCNRLLDPQWPELVEAARRVLICEENGRKEHKFGAHPPAPEYINNLRRILARIDGGE